MTLWTILGFVVSVDASVVLSWIFFVALRALIRDRDLTFFTRLFWLTVGIPFVIVFALTVWQPLHWAGVA